MFTNAMNSLSKLIVENGIQEWLNIFRRETTEFRKRLPIRIKYII